MKTIKTRKTVKDIKTLDKSANLSTRMKDAFIRTKDSAEQTQITQHTSPSDYAAENIQGKMQGAARGIVARFHNPRQKAHENLNRAKGHFQEAKRQLPQDRKRAAEQARKTAQKSKDDAEKLKNAAEKAQNKAREAKKAVTDAKQSLREVQQTGRQMIQDSQNGLNTSRNLSSRPSYLNQGVKAQNKAGNAANKAARSVKSTKKGFKETTKGTIKTVTKSVKSVEKMAHQSVKTAQRTARTAQKAAKSTARAAKRAEKAARAAAKAAAKATKATVKVVSAMVKIAIAAIKGLVALIAAGGWVVLLVILLIAMILLLLNSIFGIFASSEPNPDTGLTINGVIAEIDTEYTDRIAEIISANAHDLLDMSGARASWKEVLVVYTVKTVTDPNNPMDVAMMTDEKAALLRTVFWDMNTVSHTLDSTTVDEDVLDADGLPTGETTSVTKTILRITVSHETPDEMAAQYGFTDEQKEWLMELLKPEYYNLWNALLYGITTFGDGSLIEVAITQLSVAVIKCTKVAIKKCTDMASRQSR